MMATNYSFAVEIKRIVKRYGEIWAVDNVDLSIRSGEIFGLLGPNGSGKSSTMKMLLGLVQPDSGAGLSRNWCKVVISLIFGFGGKFEAHSPSLFLCSSRPSQTCKRALSD
jgi:ABC-type polysaccharide/polyol phosphate transport system ATPase subunit